MSTTLTISGLIETSVTLSIPTTISSSGTVETSELAAVVGSTGFNTLANSGRVMGEVFGISLAESGDITNNAGGEISGAAAIEILGFASIVNFGVIGGGETGLILNSAKVTNEASGKISGGVQINSGTLTNDGTIARATGDIVYFSDGGTISNLGSSANLTGGDVLGVVVGGAPGVVFNQGSISGVELLDGGAVTNAGYIGTGNSSFGVEISQLPAYVENTGDIVGVALNNGGNVVNGAGGTVSGYVDGVDLASGGSVSNSGNILGIGARLSAVEPGRDGISLNGNGIIYNNAGALIKGSNDGITISSGSVTITNHGTITGKKGIIVDSSLATTIINYGTISGLAGTAIAFQGGDDVLQLESGSVVDGIIVGGSTQDVTLTLEGSISRGSSIELEAGGSLTLSGSLAASQTISFAGTDASLMIGDASQFQSEVAGLTAGDTIDLINSKFDPSGYAYVKTNNILEIIGVGTTAVQLDPKQNFAHEFFHISSDGLNGTDITESAIPCFLAGTRIATDSGEAKVEDLKIGDVVLNGAGAPKAIKWIGRRCYTTPMAEDPDVVPVLVKAGALAPDVPRTNLYLSPRHALRIDGFLVPVGALINGFSIRSSTEIVSIQYYHIEMDDHDTIFANGAEAETFIDHDSRKMFENADEFYRLYPAAWAIKGVLCAPRLEFGPELEAVRRKIALRAGLLLDHSAGAEVIGYLETTDRQTISGWAYAPAQPNVPVSLEIFNRGSLLARTIANMQRSDVKNAGFGNGRCGFSVTLPAPLPALLRHEISVKPIGAATPLIGSPVVIDPAIAHDLIKTGGLKVLIDAAVQGLCSATEVVHLGRFLEAAGRNIRIGAEAPRRRLKTTAAVAADHSRPMVLVLDTAWPTVTRDAGSNAIVSHIDAFLQLGYAVAFCATAGAPDHEDTAAGLDALQQRGVHCHGQDGASAETTIRVLAAHQLDVVYLHRIATASAYGGLVRQLAPTAKVIFSVADLHHVRLARQAAVCDRPDLATKARSVKAAELWAMQLADCVITHSRFEATYLRAEVPGVNVHVVPWAVEARPPLSASRNERDIAFIGGAGHAPNLDAVMHLARDIMPLVWQADPFVRCLIAGADWSGNLFATFDPRVVNLGHQPDLAPLLRAVKLTVAPVRFGAGIKGKVLESMAAGAACVMSEIAAEGLPLDTHLRGIVGDGPAIAQNILAVYTDKKLKRLVVQAGIDMIETDFSCSAVVSALAEALGQRMLAQGALPWLNSLSTPEHHRVAPAPSPPPRTARVPELHRQNHH